MRLIFSQALISPYPLYLKGKLLDNKWYIFVFFSWRWIENISNRPGLNRYSNMRTRWFAGYLDCASHPIHSYINVYTLFFIRTSTFRPRIGLLSISPIWASMLKFWKLKSNKENTVFVKFTFCHALRLLVCWASVFLLSVLIKRVYTWNGCVCGINEIDIIETI